MPKLNPEIHSYFDEATNAACYIVKDPSSAACAVIDSIWDFDMASGRTHTAHADMLIDEISKNGWRLDWVIETHVHADHLSAAPYLVQQVGGKIAIGSNIDTVQKVFGKVFNAGTEFQMDGSQFDKLFDDRTYFKIGNMDVEVMHTPGHTPACVTYVIGNSAFIGDTLFMPDFGTGRCDFPNGDANELYDSVVNKLYTLPSDTKVFVGHDYQPNGRELKFETTIGAAKKDNIQLKSDTPREEFVKWRQSRDRTLHLPKLIFQSVQVNINGGALPEPNEEGIRILKLPMNTSI